MQPILLATLTALPWLQGFFAPQGVTEQGSRSVLAEVAEWGEPAEDCVASAYGGLSLQANIGPAEGDEKILASFTQGVFVLDTTRHLIARAPGLTCEGSADELVALAAGDASIGMPVIALAATSGGRAENVTWLMLYRVADDGTLQPIFTGEVERHSGSTSRTGVVTVIPGGLIFQDTRGSIGLWVYDEQRGRYIEELTTRTSV